MNNGPYPGTTYNGNPQASSLTGAEVVPLLQNGRNRWTTANAIAALHGGGGGGFISMDRAIDSGISDTASVNDGLILWNSSAAGTKSQTIPASTGSLQVLIIMDFYGNSDDYPIIISPESGTINNGLSYVEISTPNNSITLLDSVLGWILQ